MVGELLRQWTWPCNLVALDWEHVETFLPEWELAAVFSENEKVVARGENNLSIGEVD